MKRLVLVILFLGLCKLCFADVTAEVVGKSIDDNGNIVIKTQYKIDGKEVESRYPKDEQDRYYWVTRYSIQNFANSTVSDRIDQDLKAYANQLITKPFQDEQRANLQKANADFYNDSMKDIVGHKITVTEATMNIDKDFDGKIDTELTVNTLGEKVEKDITDITPIK